MNPKDRLANQLKQAGIEFKRDYQIEQPSCLVFDFCLPEHKIVIDVTEEILNEKKRDQAAREDYLYYRVTEQVARSGSGMASIQTLVDLRMASD